MRLTPNQREFFELQERVFRWQEYAEKKDLFVDYFFPEKPERITKEYLKELKAEIPKKRWQFLEEYATTQSGKKYHRPLEEKLKAHRTALKSAHTKFLNKIHQDLPAYDTDYSPVYNDVDEQQKAFNYVQTIIKEMDTGINTELMQEFQNILQDFVNNYADEPQALIFNQNYERNKALIDSDFAALAYESGEGDDSEMSRLTDEVLDYLFAGTDFNPDLTILRALVDEVGSRSRDSYALAYEMKHPEKFR
jgi:hypothetical protein